jgi:hypothetical protein
LRVRKAPEMVPLVSRRSGARLAGLRHPPTRPQRSGAESPMAPQSGLSEVVWKGPGPSFKAAQGRNVPDGPAMSCRIRR